MHQFLQSISILACVALASAQSATSSSSSSSAVQTISVGKSGLVYEPDSIQVPPGGQVEFHFYSAHSVAQAAFASPCKPISETGLYSGPVVGSPSKPTVFTVTVNDTNPIWFYCGVPGHCEAGMVGVINPPSSGSDTLSAFKSSASNTQDTTVPNSIGGGIFGTASAASAASTSSTASSSSGTSSGTSSMTTMTTSSMGSTSGSGTGTSSATSTSAASSASTASSPTPTGEARALSAWTELSVLFILSMFATMCIL